MFDREIISTARRAFTKLLKDPSESSEFLRTFMASYGLKYTKVCKHVLLFDYIFALEYQFTEPYDIGTTAVDTAHMSKRTYLSLVQRMEELRHNKLQKVLPVYGKHLTTILGKIDIYVLHAALLTPSEPYDVCLMGWDDWYEVFYMTCLADVDDFIPMESKLYTMTTVNPYYSIPPVSVLCTIAGDIFPSFQRHTASGILQYGPDSMTEQQQCSATRPHMYEFTGQTYLSDIFN